MLFIPVYLREERAHVKKMPCFHDHHERDESGGIERRREGGALPERCTVPELPLVDNQIED